MDGNLCWRRKALPVPGTTQAELGFLQLGDESGLGLVTCMCGHALSLSAQAAIVGQDHPELPGAPSLASFSCIIAPFAATLCVNSATTLDEGPLDEGPSYADAAAKRSMKKAAERTLGIVELLWNWPFLIGL